jgi:hypothetical protein
LGIIHGLALAAWPIIVGAKECVLTETWDPEWKVGIIGGAYKSVCMFSEFPEEANCDFDFTCRPTGVEHDLCSEKYDTIFHLPGGIHSLLLLYGAAHHRL